VSKLLTGSAEDTTVPFPIYKCDECGHINKGFNPFEDEEETKLTLND
jgi:predicted nucleic acid-binding Zn ribbon protein